MEAQPEVSRVNVPHSSDTPNNIGRLQTQNSNFSSFVKAQTIGGSRGNSKFMVPGNLETNNESNKQSCRRSVTWADPKDSDLPIQYSNPNLKSLDDYQKKLTQSENYGGLETPKFEEKFSFG